MIRTWTLGMAVLTLTATSAFSNDSVSEWTYDGNVVAVACDSCCDDGCCDDGCCGDPCCGSCCCERGGLLGAIEDFTLAGMLGIEGLDVGGWTQFGYHDNATPLSAAYGDGLAFNDVPDQLNLQQQWFYIGKTADASCGADWGFRADIVYGTDAQKTQAFGNPGNEWDVPWDHGVYGWALPQLYGEIAVGDLSVIVGHFYTLTGYEVVTAPDNFFYSHALTMFNSEPFTHTGVLTTYTGFEGLTIYNGWSLGWDTGFANTNSGNSYLGGVGVELMDSVSLTYILNWGNFGARDGGNNDSYSHSVVLDVALTDKLQYVLQSDYLRTDVEDDFGINQYLIYNWNDLLDFGARIEWWKDEGVSFNEATFGANVHLLDNLNLRPEYRKDWSPGTGLDQDTFGCDLVLTY